MSQRQSPSATTILLFNPLFRCPPALFFEEPDWVVFCEGLSAPAVDVETVRISLNCAAPVEPEPVVAEPCMAVPKAFACGARAAVASELRVSRNLLSSVLVVDSEPVMLDLGAYCCSVFCVPEVACGAGDWVLRWWAVGDWLEDLLSCSMRPLF